MSNSIDRLSSMSSKRDFVRVALNFLRTGQHQGAIALALLALYAQGNER